MQNTTTSGHIKKLPSRRNTQSLCNNKGIRMKTMIIPDVHLRYFRAEVFIREENPDKIVFLGDYFDNFWETIEDIEKTASWLSRSLKRKNRIHLLGNHDLPYMSPINGPGYSEDKQNIIDG